MNQLEFRDEENRYETASQAQSMTSPEQKEQLQVLSKLSELARRQEDINKRLQELQTQQKADVRRARKTHSFALSELLKAKLIRVAAHLLKMQRGVFCFGLMKYEHFQCVNDFGVLRNS